MNAQNYSVWYDTWAGKGKVNDSNIPESLKQRYEMCCFFFVYFWNILSFSYTIANEELVLFWIWIKLKFVKTTITRFWSQRLIIVLGPSGVQFREFRRSEIITSILTDRIGRHNRFIEMFVFFSHEVLLPIGHFRVPLCLCFKASLSAKPFLWKWLWFTWKWNCMQNSFSYERFRT